MCKEVLCSILNISVDNLQDHTWMQCCLPVDEGGLGIGYMDDLKDAAYVSSVAVCFQSIRDHLAKIGKHITPDDVQRAVDADFAEQDPDPDNVLPTMLQQF